MNNQAQATVIGAQTRIKGEIECQDSLVVAGHLEGAIRLGDELVIEPGGIVIADVQAARVLVGGTLVGNVTATESVRLGAQGKLLGDVQCPQLVLADGAALRGNVSAGPAAAPSADLRARPAPSSARPAPAAAPPASSAAPRPRAPLPTAPVTPLALRRERPVVTERPAAPERPGASERPAASERPGVATRGAAASAAGSASVGSAIELGGHASGGGTSAKVPRPPTAAGKKSRVKRR